MIDILKVLAHSFFHYRLVIYQRIMVFLFNKVKDCNIHSSVVIKTNSSFNKVTIGFGSYLSKNAKINNTIIGKFCSIGPNFLCGFGVHPINGISTSPCFYSTEKQNGFTFVNENKVVENKIICIGNDVFIGANVTVLDGVVIGDGAVIGAGAVVSKDIPPYAVAIGCPIKIIRYRFSSDVIEKLVSIAWWNKDKDVWQKLERHFFNVEEFIKLY